MTEIYKEEDNKKEKFPLIHAPDSPKAFWYYKRGRRRNDFQKKIDVHQQITQAYR